MSGKHCKTCICGRRALVQGDYEGYPHPDAKARLGRDPKGPGTISWEEHEKAWSEYARMHSGQSAERMNERGGFGYGELIMFLGREPETWVPRGREGA